MFGPLKEGKWVLRWGLRAVVKRPPHVAGLWVSGNREGCIIRI
jgi:hypothetical protein